MSEPITVTVQRFSVRLFAGILLGTIPTLPAWGQTGCADVPESRQAQCEKVMDCMAIEDADIRRACIATAQLAVDEPTQAKAVEQRRATRTATQTNQVSAEIQPIEDDAEAVQAVQPEARQVIPPPPLVDQTVVTRREAREGTRVAPEAPLAREPPASFTGEVTRIHKSILDRQVIALDDSYLFVGERAAEARLKVGQMVEAEKARSRIGSGRTWRLVGPARRPVDAFRIRCERDDLGTDNRRRCDRMLGR